MARRAFLGTPRRRLLAVVDDPAAADAAVTALAAAGFDPATIERFEGPDAAAAFDATGAAHGPVARLRRVLEFTLMDQLPDFAWYEAAVREGRIVLMVPAPDSAAGRRAAAAIGAAGGHFINRYGRLQTEDIAPWRGPEPPVADLMKR